MLGKKIKQLSLGQMEAVSRLPKDHLLKVVDQKIDWRPIEKELNKLYPSKRGRPSYPPRRCCWRIGPICLMRRWRRPFGTGSPFSGF